VVSAVLSATSCLMDFSFSVWPLQCKASVAAEYIQFKFPLWMISRLHEKDVHLLGPHCPTHSLNVNKVHAAEHWLHSSSVLQEFR